MRRRRDLARLVILALPLVIGIGGCAAAGTSGPSGASGASAAPPSATTRAAPTVSAPAPAPSAMSVGRPSSSLPAIAVDARLLEVLPTEIDGVALEADPSTAARIAADPALASSAEAIAVALAISPTTSTGEDLAIASVVRLRPGVFSDAWFRTWRSDYDTAACAEAGGLAGHPSEIEIGGRAAYVGTCAGDTHTYHVHLADPAIVVAITAAGARGFGELVVAGLSE